MNRTRISPLTLVLLLVLGPVAPAFAERLPIQILAITTPVTRGTDASISIQTEPGAKCRAKVRIAMAGGGIPPSGKAGAPSRKAGATPGKTGTSPAKSGGVTGMSLGTRVADARGRVAWTARVDTQIPPGSVPIIVQCVGGGRHGQVETRVEIR